MTTEQDNGAAFEPPIDCRVMRRVVCAAMKDGNGKIICGPRHWDKIMHQQFSGIAREWEQGFVDQRGEFLTREDAWKIAEAAGQIIRRVGGDGGRLFSENLY